MNDKNLDDLAMIAACCRRLITRSLDDGQGKRVQALMKMSATTMAGLCVVFEIEPPAVQARVAELLPDPSASVPTAVH
jgi:hypothetical protein